LSHKVWGRLAGLRRLVGLWQRVSANYYGDFYPLTTWTRDKALWMAWQFDRPEAGEGVVQVFRRENSYYESARLRLQGLEPNARYRVKHLGEIGSVQEFTGRALREQGISVTIASRPDAVILLYTRLK
jgi:alpha-galactosidase